MHIKQGCDCVDFHGQLLMENQQFINYFLPVNFILNFIDVFNSFLLLFLCGEKNIWKSYF